MADEKKVVFSADDKVSAKANQIAQTILSNAAKQTASLKEQNALINEQIKLLQKQADTASKNLKSRLAEYNEMAPGKAKMEYGQQQVRPARLQVQEAAKTNELLKAILDAQKKTSASTEKNEKENEKENTRKAKYEDLRAARVEARENPEDIKKKYTKAEKSGYGNMTAAEVERLEYQKRIADKEKPAQESTFKSMFSAMMAVGAVNSVTSGLHSIMTAQTGAQATSSLVTSASGGVGGALMSSGNPWAMLGGAILKGVGMLAGTGMGQSSEARMALQPGFTRMSAMSGRDIELGGNIPLGFSSLQAQAAQEALLKASGSSANLSRNTGQIQTLNRGLGIDQQTLTSIAETTRMVRSSDDIVQVVSKVIKSNPELVKDQTRLSGILQNTLALTKTLATQSENINMGHVASMVGALRSVGGTFADPTLGMNNMSAINQSLTNPQNDYQKARSFGVLSALQPGSSYFQLLEMKEKGVGQQGYLSAMLAQLKRETGGGENFALAAMTNLGLGASTSRKLTQAFTKNPEMFKKFSGEVTDETVAELTGGERAKKYTPQVEREQAASSEAALNGMIDGMLQKFNNTWNHITGKFDESTTRLSDVINNKYGPNAIHTE